MRNRGGEQERKENEKVKEEKGNEKDRDGSKQR